MIEWKPNALPARKPTTISPTLKMSLYSTSQIGSSRTHKVGVEEIHPKGSCCQHCDGRHDHKMFRDKFQSSLGAVCVCYEQGAL